MIGLTTGLFTIYTGALTFLKVPDNMGTLSPPILWMAAPILFWFASIILNAGVYYPRKIGFYPGSPESVKAALENVASRKYLALALGFTAFILALGLASIVIVNGGLLHAPADPETVQFIVADEQVPLFKSMNVSMIDGTMKTKNITLIDTEDGNYKIQVPGENLNITFNQSLVKGVIYF
jgi:hypothetical protein